MKLALAVCSVIGMQLVVASVGKAAPGTPESSAAPSSCSKALGAARAKRIVTHCLNISTATHPPCAAVNACETIVDHIMFMCSNNAGPTPPAFCREYTSATQDNAPAAPQIEERRLAATAAADSSDATKHRQAIGSSLVQIQALAQARKQAATKYKTDLGELTKHLRSAKTAYERYKAAARKDGSAKSTADGLQLARSEYAASVSQGKVLVLQYAGLQKIDEQLATHKFSTSMASLSAQVAAVDAADAASLISSLALAGAREKTPAALALTAELQATAKQTQSQASSAKAAASAAGADAKVAANAAVTSGAPTFKDSQTLASDLQSAQQSLAEVDTLLKRGATRPATPATPVVKAISGTTEVPTAEVIQRYGSAPDETMEKHPEILAAMTPFDADADVLSIPNENRVVRTRDGRELLLMSGRTSRARGQVAYWIAWDAKRRVVAFTRDNDNVPVHGKPDPTLRAVLEEFAKASFP